MIKNYKENLQILLDTLIPLDGGNELVISTPIDKLPKNESIFGKILSEGGEWIYLLMYIVDDFIIFRYKFMPETFYIARCEDFSRSIVLLPSEYDDTPVSELSKEIAVEHSKFLYNNRKAIPHVSCQIFGMLNVNVYTLKNMVNFYKVNCSDKTFD